MTSCLTNLTAAALIHKEATERLKRLHSILAEVHLAAHNSIASPTGSHLQRALAQLEEDGPLPAWLEPIKKLSRPLDLLEDSAEVGASRPFAGKPT